MGIFTEEFEWNVIQLAFYQFQRALSADRFGAIMNMFTERVYSKFN